MSLQRQLFQASQDIDWNPLLGLGPNLFQYWYRLHSGYWVRSVSYDSVWLHLVRQNAAVGRHKNAAIGAQDMRESNRRQ